MNRNYDTKCRYANRVKSQQDRNTQISMRISTVSVKESEFTVFFQQSASLEEHKT